MVSVLMTSYNRESFIQESINSVLSQNYHDFEFIIVDDASTDSTWEIIQCYAQKDQRIKAFRNTQNQGDYANRNIAASYATRKYLKYLDSDDILNPGSLLIMVESMERNPNVYIGLIGIGLNLKKDETRILSPIDTYRYVFFQGKIIGCGPSFSIIRKSAFEDLGKFSTKPYLSDFEFWLKILAIYPLCVFDESLVFWRKHPRQEYYFGETTHYNLFNSFHLYKCALHNVNCPLSSNESVIALRNLKNRYSRHILRALISGKFRFAAKLIRVTSICITDLIISFSPNRYPNSFSR